MVRIVNRVTVTGFDCSMSMTTPETVSTSDAVAPGDVFPPLVWAGDPTGGIGAMVGDADAGPVVDASVAAAGETLGAGVEAHAASETDRAAKTDRMAALVRRTLMSSTRGG
jgi:hypothetical protein